MPKGRGEEGWSTATERKPTRRGSNVEDFDYQLQKEYLQKLRAQRGKAERLLGEYQQLEKALRDSRERMSGVEEENRRLREEMGRRDESYRVQIGQLRMALQAHESKEGQGRGGRVQSSTVVALQAEMDELRRQRGTLEERVEQLEEELERERGRSHELQLEIGGKLKATCRQLEAANRVQQGVVGQIHQQKAAVEAELRQVREERDRVSRELHSKALEMAERTRHQGELKERDRRVAEITSEFRRATAQWEGRQSDQDRAGHFIRQELSSIQSALEAAQASYQQVSAQLGEARQQRDHLRSENERLETVVRIVQDEYGRACRQLVGFKTANQGLNGEVVRLRGEVHELRLELDDCEVRLERRKLLELERHQVLEEELRELGRFEAVWRVRQEATREGTSEAAGE